MDAIHIAVAVAAGADEFVSAEKPGKPMFRVKEIAARLTIQTGASTMPHQLIIDYDDLLANVALSPYEFAEEAHLLLAAKLYEQGKLSSGQAAKLCVKGRVEFLYSLVRAGIPMSNLRPGDVEFEIDFALHG
jgi:predicted HTH domain antitoxin